MEPILPPSIPSAASTARGSSEQRGKAGSPDTAHSGENRFENVLKRTTAGPEDPAKGRPSAQGGRRAAIAAKEDKTDTSTPPSVSAAVWGSVAPTAPDDSLPAAGGAASEPKGAGPAKTDPAPVLAGAATLPAEGDPLLKQLSTGIHLAAASGEKNAAPAQAPEAGGPVTATGSPTAAASEPKNAGSANAAPAQASRAGSPVTVSAPLTAAASEPKNAGSTIADPTPVLAGAATLPAEGDPLLKQLSTGIHPAAASGEENAAPAQAPRAGSPVTVSAPLTAEASEPKDAGSANADPAQAPKAGGPVTVSAPPTSAASEPKNAGSANADPVPVLASAATLLAEEGPFLKHLSSGVHPAAASGEENATPAQAPKAGGPMTASASPTAAASEPKNAGSARVDGPPVCYGNSDPAPEGARGAEGIRKKKDDASARIEGQAEPVATPPADGNRGVAERPAPPRPVGPASDPGVVRFEEKAFVITRKSDTSVEVTLAPPGVGKLEIEVVLEKGVVNARIIAADSAGREAIARSLPQIVEALARDGMNIGGFTVSLKERRDRTEDAPGHGASRDPDARLLSAVHPAASASAASAGLVDIFV